MSKIWMLVLAGGLMACAGNECEKAADRMEAVLADCGVENDTTATTSATTTTTTEVECTEEDGAAATCTADCAEAADCAALDMSDMDAAMELVGCMADCYPATTTGTGTTTTTTTTTTTGT